MFLVPLLCAYLQGFIGLCLPAESDWALHDVTKNFDEEAIGAYKDSSVTERTRITFTSSIQMSGGTWVHQSEEDIGLLDTLESDPTRDLYLCSVLKFQCDLVLDTPSEDVMIELIDMLELMCDKEEVHEIGGGEGDRPWRRRR